MLLTKKLPLLFLFFLIIFRYFSLLPKFNDGDLIKINTVVSTEPIQYADSQYLKLYELKVYAPKYPEISYGDRIEITGRVEEGKLKDPKVFKLQASGVSIYELRKKVIDFYKRALPEPHSSLVAGMVLGSRQMPASFWEMLKTTGTAHVVVASGTNVAMIGGFLMSLGALFLKRKNSLVFVFLGICVYIVLSGFDAPIIRAGIMGFVAFTAQALGRVINSLKALFYSVLVMLLIKPFWISDLGFILSVLATLGIILFNKRIDAIFKFLPVFFREGITTSLSAQIFVAPVIFATFGQFNIFSFVINAFILWTVPYIMAIGGISAFVGLIIPKIGEIILYLVYPLTLFFIKVVEIFG